MAEFYPYIVSSLPALTFGMRPPLSFDRFIALCKGLIPDEDLATVATIPALEGASCAIARNQTLRAWLAFDAMLRNELVRIRALRKKADPAKYLRADGCPESLYSAHIAINAYRKTSVLEAEKALDIERWRSLDELAFGHYFDIDTLIIYAIKLLILEKWDRVMSADGGGLMEKTLAVRAAKE